MKLPPIGITIGEDDRRQGRHALREDYVKAVERADGLPLVFAPIDPSRAPDLLDHVRGLLLTGGADIDPALYGEEPHENLGRVNRERDDFELALVRSAIERDIPLLAICRGHQVLNVALGGTLIQDIPTEVVGEVEHDSRRERWEIAHEVNVARGTRLHAIVGADVVEVNSFHHQAVEKVGRGLVVSARSRQDQVVEAVELPGHRFAVGVQWHPESFWRDVSPGTPLARPTAPRGPGFSALFRALVEAASAQ